MNKYHTPDSVCKAMIERDDKLKFSCGDAQYLYDLHGSNNDEGAKILDGYCDFLFDQINDIVAYIKKTPPDQFKRAKLIEEIVKAQLEKDALEKK